MKNIKQKTKEETMYLLFIVCLVKTLEVFSKPIFQTSNKTEKITSVETFKSLTSLYVYLYKIIYPMYYDRYLINGTEIKNIDY